MLDSCAMTTTAVAEIDEFDGAANESEWAGARCEKCKAPLVSDVVSICRHCGWYASLGQFVEVDPEMEIAAAPPATTTAAVARPSHLQVWLRLLPWWSWIVIASVVVLLIESIVARFATEGNVRTTWSLCQLTIGLLAAFGCHVFNFLVLTADDAEIGLLDLVMRPLRLWMRSVEQLPRRLWVFDGLVSGIVAAALSALVIGSLPYERLLDWGFKEPPKRDLMAAVMDQAKKLDNGKNDGDLEQSINDFAGKAGNEADDKPKNDPPKPKQTADCVILGFQLDREGRLTSLVLGTASSGQLVYAGNVTPKLNEDEINSLAASLRSITTLRPLLHIELEATWVQPKYACRVNYSERAPSGRLREIEWNTLLGNIERQTRGK